MQQLRIDQSGLEEHAGGLEDDCEAGVEEDGEEVSSVLHKE